MSLPNLETVNRIWCQSKGDFVFQSFKKGGHWTDHPLLTSNLPGTHHRLYPTDLIEQPHGHDMYFSALRSTDYQRGNEFFGGAAILFADLDPVEPEGLQIQPTIAWETSPNSFQAVWFLDEAIGDYKLWAQLNQRMTRYTGADPGGWMGSKVMRWPGSLNWKRERDGMVPVGRLLWDDGPEYDWLELHNELPVLTRPQADTIGDWPDPIKPGLVDKALVALRRKHWPDLNARSRSMVSRKKVVDRSFFVAKTVKQLINDGLSPEETFHLVWVQPWCKWRTDRDAPEVLWSEIRKAL